MQNAPSVHEQGGQLQSASRHPSTTSDLLPLSQPISSQQQPQGNDFGYDSSGNVIEDSGPDIEDSLPGVSDKERFGLKGLLAVLKGPYPDQAALITGVDINTLGLDLNSNE